MRRFFYLGGPVVKGQKAIRQENKLLPDQRFDCISIPHLYYNMNCRKAEDEYSTLLPCL